MNLEGAYKAIKSNSLLNAGIQSKDVYQVIIFFLNASSVEAFTNSKGNWVYHCTALTFRKFSLIFNQNLASFNLSPLLRVLHSGMIENGSWPSSV